jgi:tetratricopeptide (TPR) repeat protein
MISTLTAATAQTRPSGNTPEIREHLRKAAIYLKQKDSDSAVKELDAVLALDPRNAEAYANLGVIAFFSRDYQSAEKNLRKAVTIKPSLVQSQALLAICEARLGNAGAKKLLESSFSKLIDPKLRTQVGMELARLYQQEGDSEHAMPVIQKLVDLNPDDVDILYMAQRLYQELAEDTLDKLAVLAPGSAQMQQIIAERLINEGDLAGATEHYKKALQIDPHIPGVHYELAQALLQSAPNDSSTQEAAKKELEAAIATDGDSAKVQCEFGKIAMQNSALDQAFRDYSAAFRLDPQDTEAQLGLGRVLMAMDKPQEAKKYLEMSVQGDPLNATAHYRLAQVYERLSMKDRATKEMHLFQEIRKTKDQVRQLYRQMNRQQAPEADEAQESEK